MWYLQTKTFLIICLYCFILAVIRKITSKYRNKLFANIITVILSVSVLFIIDINLAIFYISYVLIGLILCNIVYYLKKEKTALFIAFSIASILPIFAIRADSIGINIPFIIVGIGFSFNMLKLMDTFFYIYYTEQKIDTLTYLNYMLFIPVFTSGPIFRYRDFIKTHENPIVLTIDELAYDAKRIIRGMFKKVVLFQVLIIIQTYILQFNINIYASLLLTVLSWFLLYFDFSGYSDIAIGFGRIAGYNVPENFKKPWKAPSFTQFWRSWHCTLSDWIREHIYIVVSKYKLNRLHSAMLAMLTMIIMALWHGFNMPYFLSCGIYLGALLAIENLLGLSTVNKRKTKKSIYILRCFIVNFLFAINTLVFTIPSDQIISVFRGFLKF